MQSFQITAFPYWPFCYFAAMSINNHGILASFYYIWYFFCLLIHCFSNLPSLQNLQWWHLFVNLRHTDLVCNMYQIFPFSKRVTLWLKFASVQLEDWDRASMFTGAEIKDGLAETVHDFRVYEDLYRIQSTEDRDWAPSHQRYSGQGLCVLGLW